MEIIVNHQSLCGNANTVKGRPKKAYGVCCCIFLPRPLRTARTDRRIRGDDYL